MEVIMSFVNESSWDRVLRIVVGVVLLGISWGGLVGGGLGVALKIIGFIPLLTGLVGFCPLYALFRFRTNKA
jgi:hypothetical protein